MTDPTLSLIVLNWNGKRFLPECLDSLAAQSYRSFEVILVDNGSTDGSEELIRTNYPWVKLVVLPENVGFAEGNNRGLAACNGQYVVALNNDTVADPGFLAELVRVAESDAAVGMVAAKMRSYFQRDTIDAMGLKVGRNGLGYNLGGGEKDLGQYEAAEPVFGPCGGAALYRRRMLEQIGFFDSDFFAYYEDFDLAWRAHLAGWTCLPAPNALVYHVHSATSGEMSPFKVYHAHRNKWYTLIINWPGALLLTSLPRIIWYDLAALVLAALHGRCGAAITARLAVFGQLGALLRKRRTVQQARRLDNRAVAGLFSPYENPLQTFRRKRKNRLSATTV